MRILFGALALVSLLIAGCGGANNPGMGQSTGMDDFGSSFGQNKNTTSSAASAFWDIQKLKTTPRVELVAESTEKSSSGDVVIKELKYDSPGCTGETLNIFAYYAYPARKQNVKLPAIIIVHGGTGLADKKATIEWASKGYAALAMDLPGKGHGRDKSRSDGPNMDDDIVFKTTPSIKSSYLYAAVNSVCRAVSLLANEKEVDSGRIGVLGSSWGGVITLITNGIDDRISAACSVWGAGCIPDESAWVEQWFKKMPAKSLREWRKNYDPMSYMANQHSKTFLVSATQDGYYPLRSFAKTVKAATCEKAIALTLNRSHQLDEACVSDITRWFDWALRSGPALPTIKVAKSGDALKVTARGPRPIMSVSLVTSDGTDFLKAKWTSKDIEGKDGVWTVKPPAPTVPYFVTAHDDNGALVASEVYLPGKK